jgi:hypothetical protein
MIVMIVYASSRSSGLQSDRLRGNKVANKL